MTTAVSRAAAGGADARALVVGACEAAAELLADPQVAASWDEPSALEGMTVGALAAHLVRAAGATIAYLDRPSGDGELLDAVEYFHQALTAPIHERIKQVSASESSAGPAELAGKCRRVAEQLADRLPAEPADRTIGALEGRRLSLDDFCRTRLIEVLVHVDDLAASVAVPLPDVPADATGTVVDVLVGIARRRHGDWAVIRTLARRERAQDGVFPVL
ncbi:MAG: hypothetical protein GEV08_18855 [Acidimicrobiia bacterium]|nr:hypothetical protein [Acidimicrobiia bacterium]